MRGRRPEGQERYMRGFFAAIEKGKAAAEEPSFTERDNPYKNFEHRTNWLLGFREQRAALKSTAAKEGGEV